MRSKALLLVIICLYACAIALGQERRAPQLVVPLESAGFVAFKAETVSPESQATSTGEIDLQSVVKPQVLVDENHVVHRVLVDGNGALIFGYDLVIVPLVNTRQFKVSVRPLDPEFEKQLRARQTSRAGRASLGLNASTLPRSTEAQVIDDGDGFALDLLVNPQTGVKIVDVVKASFDQSRLWEAPPRPARDFTLDNVQLAVKDYKLYINGQLIAGGRPTKGISGALIWFYVPERGRFIFSLTPREGYDFEKVARTEDNKISFTMGGDYYELISSAPVVGSGGNWNLWVLRDTHYTPFVDYDPEALAQTRDTAEQSSEPAKKTGPLIPGLSLDTTRPNNSRTQKTEQASAKTRDTQSRAPALPQPPRTRVEVGSADRIENLWPKK